MSRSLNLDIYKLNFTRDGAEGFLWPFPYKEREGFANFITNETVKFSKTIKSDEAIAYKIALKYFIAEAISVFWADALKQRFEKEGVKPLVPADWQYWPYLFEGKVPAQPKFVKMIVDGPASKKQKNKISSFYKKVMKAFQLVDFKNGGLNLNGLKLKPLTDNVLKNDIIATQRIQKILLHASTEKKDVVFIRSTKWFSNVGDEELAQGLGNLSSKDIEGFMNIIKQGYENYNIGFPDYCYDYLTKLLEEITAALHVHHKRLFLQPKKLPNHLWTGTGGDVWDLLLRLAVRENGGHTVGHDHGAGLAHVDYSLMGFVEFWACDEFITFNGNQAAELTLMAQDWELCEESLPKISGLKGKPDETSFKIYPRHVANKNLPKQVMLMTEIYDRDRGRLGPSCPDIIQADWQARIVPRLKEWGYDVMMKLHPESPFPPPPVFETEMGAVIETTRMEEVLDKADVIIFDCLYSTSFRVAVETNIPFVLIDFYDHPWTDKARAMIQKRCSFIQGGFDELGRRVANWNDVEQGIKDAAQKANNTEFYDYYYA